MRAVQIDPASPTWSDQLRQMRRWLADRPSLLPHHFLESVLPKIGGLLFALVEERTSAALPPLGYAFLLPRTISPNGPVYTLRFEPMTIGASVNAKEIARTVQRELALDLPDIRNLQHRRLHQFGGQLLFYRPDMPQQYTPTHIIQGVDYGHPDAAEATAIRQLQQTIWHSPCDSLYPRDLHSDDAGLGTSLVARVDGKMAAFLLGFYCFGGMSLPAPWHKFRQDLRLESQLLAVAPAQRRRRIGQFLKRLQAHQALADGIDLISWTMDPLLFPNALLNFTRLRAITWEFQPSLYTFRNELNQVPASRLHVLWSVRSQRVQTALAGQNQAKPLTVAPRPDLTIVNQAAGMTIFNADTPRIAIEIPADWITLQREDRVTAQRWRDVTDRLLGHYLGPQPGHYILTEAGVSASRYFLIGERVDGKLLDRLAESAAT